MKFLDDIKVIKNCKYYNDNGVFIGRIGTIISAEIRDNTFLVVFIDERFFDKNFEWTEQNMQTVKDDIFLEMNIEDMEVVEESDVTDEDILKSIPLQNKKWWCKVENGFIKNLFGEKKNKIQFDYNS